MAYPGPFPHRKAIDVLARNGIFQQLESLQTNRQKRYRQNLTVIEGVRLLEAASRFRVPIEAIVYSKERHPSSWAQDVMRDCQPERFLALSSSLFASLSRRSDPPELMAVIRTPEDHLSGINRSRVPLILILDRPSSPGNIGSIIRLADALGIDGVIVFGHAADVYSPEAVTASMGSIFAVPTVRVERMSTQAYDLWERMSVGRPF